MSGYHNRFPCGYRLANENVHLHKLEPRTGVEPAVFVFLLTREVPSPLSHRGKINASYFSSAPSSEPKTCPRSFLLRTHDMLRTSHRVRECRSNRLCVAGGLPRRTHHI